MRHLQRLQLRRASASTLDAPCVCVSFPENPMTNRQDVSNLVVCRYFLRSEFAKGTFPADPLAFTDEKIRREMTALGQNPKHSSNPAVVRLGFSPKGGKAAEKWKHIRDIDARTHHLHGIEQSMESRFAGSKWEPLPFLD